MKTIEYRTIDKTGWPDGPWMHEPDKAQWTDAATGLPCLIVRNSLGALCGYVGVDDKHPWYGLGYSDRPDGKPQSEESSWDDPSIDGVIRVHGGLTFASHCSDGAEESAICHLPEPGEPDRVWWFGFDCAHSGDHYPSPRMLYRSAFRDAGIYRDFAYVRGQCAELAMQLLAKAILPADLSDAIRSAKIEEAA